MHLPNLLPTISFFTLLVHYLLTTESEQAIPSVLFLCLFIVGFSIGPGSLFWVLLPQTFQPEQRQAGCSLFNAAQVCVCVCFA
jgi:predicted MFS family arabinose efflux permease